MHHALRRLAVVAETYLRCGTLPPTMQQDATQLLRAIEGGDAKAADDLLAIVYDDLHRVASNCLRTEAPDNTFQTTALADEVFVRLINQENVTWEGRAHFFAVAAKAMRHILVDHARRRGRLRRGGGRRKFALEEALTVSPERGEDVLALDEVLERLAGEDEVGARIVELRFFVGMSVEEVAVVLDMPKRNVERRWTRIRAWLRRELERSGVES
jgi:RNA polymerase sigma factor (TIGR02999 family)